MKSIKIFIGIIAFINYSGLIANTFNIGDRVYKKEGDESKSKVTGKLFTISNKLILLKLLLKGEC